MKKNKLKKPQKYKKGGKVEPYLTGDERTLGNLPIKAGNGTAVEPYVTKDPKDPRIQAYRDSLTLYNYGEKENTWLKTAPKLNNGAVDNEAWKNIIYSDMKKFIPAYDRLTKLNKKEPSIPSNYVHFQVGIKGIEDIPIDNYFTRYKKPTQKVILQKDQVPTQAVPQQPTKKPVSTPKVEPYITKNPNDPRIRAYRDSSAAYNISKKYYHQPPDIKYTSKDRDILQKLGEKFSPINQENFYRGVDGPLESGKWSGSKDGLYKKPIQEVIFQTEQEMPKDTIKVPSKPIQKPDTYRMPDGTLYNSREELNKAVPSMKDDRVFKKNFPDRIVKADQGVLVQPNVTNSYNDKRNKNLNTANQATDAVSSVFPIVGAFKAIGQGTSNAIAPKDQYGVSNKGGFANTVAGAFDPADQTQSAFQDLSKGKFSGNTFLKLSGLGGEVMNQENRMNRNAIIRQNVDNTRANMQDNGPIYMKDGGLANGFTMVNAEKNELVINPKSKQVVTDLKNLPPHPKDESKIDPDGNIAIKNGLMVVPKNGVYGREAYLKAKANNNKEKLNTITQEISNRTQMAKLKQPVKAAQGYNTPDDPNNLMYRPETNWNMDPSRGSTDYGGLGDIYNSAKFNNYTNSNQASPQMFAPNDRSSNGITYGSVDSSIKDNINGMYAPPKSWLDKTNQGTINTPYRMDGGNTPPPGSKGKGGGFLNFLSNNAGNLYQMGNAIANQEKTNIVPNMFQQDALNTMKNRKFNIKPILDQNRSTYSTGKYALKNSNGGNSSSYISSLTGMLKNKYMADSNAWAEKNNVENGYQGDYAAMLNQSGEYNRNEGIRVQTANEQNRARRQDMIGTSLSTMGQNRQMEKNDQIRLSMLQWMFPGLKGDGYQILEQLKKQQND